MRTTLLLDVIFWKVSCNMLDHGVGAQFGGCSSASMNCRSAETETGTTGVQHVRCLGTGVIRGRGDDDLVEGV